MAEYHDHSLPGPDVPSNAIPAAVADVALPAAIAHHASGQLDEAEAIYRQILAQDPGCTPALHLLGVLAHQRGNNEAAAALVREAIRLSPQTADFHANYGLILHAMNRMPEAVAALSEAVRLNPGHVDAHNNLGAALRAIGRLDDAGAHFRHAIAIHPDSRLARVNLAELLFAQRCFEPAVAAFREAIALAPNDWGPVFRLGLLFQQIGKPAEALAQYRRVLELDPACVEAHTGFGNVYRDLGRFDDSLASFRRAAELRPDLAECRYNLASGLIMVGMVDEGMQEALAALRVKPELDEAHTGYLLGLQYRVHPAGDVLRAHREWALLRAESLPRQGGVSHRAAFDTSPRRLRIGFLSADFNDHPIAYFVGPLFAAHDRQRLEFTAYSSVLRPDAATRRLQADVGRWRDVFTVPHERLAQMIAEDAIDILIDLAGHTTGSRLPVLARKAAPVQVSYLGYPGTTGLTRIDYRLTDVWADPPGMTDLQYVETLVRLPRTLACYAPPALAPAVGESPALRPERGGWITFASFSSLAKIAPETLDLWSSTLRAVPRSRLVLMARGADGATFGPRFRAAITAAGVDPARIELRPSAAIDRYLAFHNEVDVLLDTFPFNGHTTLCHALWMGVPVVSLAGDRFASRLGLSVLTNVELSELVASAPADFARIALELTQDLGRLARLRRGLRQWLSQSPLMDRRQFALDFEHALRQMWAQGPTDGGA